MPGIIDGDIPVNGGGETVLLGGLESIENTEDLWNDILVNCSSISTGELRVPPKVKDKWTKLTSGVTASGGRVGHDQTDLLGGVDDEDGTDGESQTLGVDVGGILVVNHVVGVGDLALGVGDDGELQLRAGDLIDILDPGMVALSVVGTETNELSVTSSELGLELSESTELSSADGGEVVGV
jgi:hypothetical protein